MKEKQVFVKVKDLIVTRGGVTLSPSRKYKATRLDNRSYEVFKNSNLAVIVESKKLIVQK